ncbi:sulfotransferase family protein [Myceligenerans salitolerans]|uniref:Sulfotransferase n=1 Tax=Myceligenerans salitolerans TaxID=1230528 RepID=A0ABS3I8U7_9MICO|nr:sulfotransferase [Myceligenerans salitolerans]MBO0609420.1 sulfotransferase [Myceligenerans salitolerans]
MSSIFRSTEHSDVARQPWNAHDLVFVAGMHRSGTTLVADMIGTSPHGSGLTGTGVAMDEGQHLQSVYIGGRGQVDRWAHMPEAHLTEAHAGADTARRLWSAWAPYWDLRKRMLVEKSPPNLTKARFLQSAFPGAKFVVLTRHPVVQSLAIRKWAKPGTGRFGFHWPRLVEHWLHAHDIFQADAGRLANVLVLRYEHLMRSPEHEIERLRSFLGAPIETGPIESGRSNEYQRVWAGLARQHFFRAGLRLFSGDEVRRSHGRQALLRDMVDKVMMPRQRGAIEERFGARVREHGYDLATLDDAEAWNSP